MTAARNKTIIRKITFLITIFSLSFPVYAQYSGSSGTAEDPYQIATAEDHAPRRLQVVVEGELVHLSWDAPYDSEGLLGYIIFRDEIVISESFVAETSYVEKAPSGGLHSYQVATFYSNGEINFGAAVECYVFLREGGSGTEHDPFLIATARQLIELVKHPDLMDQNFRLVSDIDLDQNLSGRQIFDRAVIAPDTSDMDEGFQGSAFTGTFDGNGHTISNLTIEGDSYLGLFGALGPEAQIIDVNVVNVNVIGNGWNIGAITGTNSGTVQDCYSSGLVMGYSDVGGLVGSNNNGHIVNSDSCTEVVGTEYVGGLVGTNNSIIASCYSSGLVMGYSDVGGLVGSNNNGHIVNSDSCTEVVGIEYVGGLVGSQLVYDSGEASVDSSNAAGSVFGWQLVGGLVGFNQGTVSKCYASSFVDGSSFLGGLIGYNDTTGLLSNCYSCSMVQGQDTVGGLVGGNAGIISFTYSASTVSGETNIGGLVGAMFKETIEEEEFSTKVIRGTWAWDIDSNSDGGRLEASVDIWWEHVNPQERYLVPMNGAGIAIVKETAFDDLNFSDLNQMDFADSRISASDEEPDIDVGTVLAIRTTEGNLAKLEVTGFDPLEEDRIEKEEDRIEKYHMRLRYVLYTGTQDEPDYDSTSSDTHDVLDEVIASFWDIEVSGQSASDGGTGLTTAELQDVNTYLEAGWDFTGETENGTENIWYITMDSYPRLFSFEGDGTSEDPYLVDTVWHLLSIGSNPDMLDKHFKLTQPIDLDPNHLGSRVFTSAVIAPDVNLANNDYDGIPFSGTFEGGNNEIRNLTIMGTGYLGLFGYLSPTAHVSDLNIVSASVVSSSQNEQGILTGVNEGTVINCQTSGLVEGSSRRTGGLIGLNYGLVSTCCSVADTQGEYYVGGLIGDNTYEGEITACNSTGTVRGTRNFVGGLIGINLGQVDKSYSTSTVTGERAVGGLLGANGSGDVTNCYSTGDVTGRSSVGGLVGGNEQGTISECYSIGLVVGDEQVGGLVGYNTWRVMHSFWNIETSSQSDSAGGFGMTTAQMQDVDTYLNAGWDFFAHEVNGHEDIWIMNLYPVHYPVRIPGQGTQANPYLISNNNAFVVLRNIEEFSSEHYRLTEDIDLAAIQFSGPVFPHFSGTFDGGGYAIHNLILIGNRDLGLFGIVEPNAKIMNLAVVEASVQGTRGQIGILANINEGYIINCSSTGSVSAGRDKHIGGLIGRNYGDIAQCFSDCVISGEGMAVGGLVGRNDGTISNCYCGGIIEGTQKTGGFVGYNLASVTNSYSSASVVSERSINGFVGDNEWQVHNCFWDVQTSGRLTSDGGTGLTTAEMQTTSTFLDAGWDFVDETENGTDDIWWILEGQDYPRLWWELIPEN